MVLHKKTRLIAVGDIALNGPYEDLLRQGKAHEVLAGVATVLARADFAIGNLEGPLTVRPSVGPPWRYCLRGHPDYAPLLRAAGIRVLSLANNHIMDYGWDAVEETLSKLMDVAIICLDPWSSFFVSCVLLCASWGTPVCNPHGARRGSGAALLYC